MLIFSAQVGQAEGYPHSLSSVKSFGFQFYVNAGSLTISKDETPPISESNSGVRAGFNGSLRFLNKHFFYGDINIFSITSPKNVRSLGHFEQGYARELSNSQSQTYKLGVGWQVYQLTSEPVEYGYKGLFGAFIMMSLDTKDFHYLLKLSPVSNTGTNRISNYNASFSFQYKLSRSASNPFYLTAEYNTIQFYSNITEYTSTLTSTFFGISKCF